MLQAYEETLQLWYTHYRVWQANIDSYQAYQAYIAVVDELALELDTNPNLPCNDDTEDMFLTCAASYGRNPSITNFNTLSGMMLYHQYSLRQGLTTIEVVCYDTNTFAKETKQDE